MGRIEKAYRTRFRWLLEHFRARRLDKGIDWLVHRAQRLCTNKSLTAAESLMKVEQELTDKAPSSKLPHVLELQFFCDAGLGGLARWLRAAGYEATWEAGIDDDVLLEKAARAGTTVLTTDSMLMERRVIRDRVIPAFWLPPTLRIPEQLRLVFKEFRLKPKPSRCMACGGVLRSVNKQELRTRIPPRTFLWKDEFFVCARCDKLYWHGTHWDRIQKELQHLTAN